MTEKEKKYEELIKKSIPVIDASPDLVSAMASISSLYKETFPETLWVGFYRIVDGKLVVGPYQGSLGCMSIELGRGVCGAAAESGRTVLVPDVHKFKGHIACDSRSNSEIVVPVMNASGSPIAVMDVDSEEFAMFDEVDRIYLEKLVSSLSDKK